MTLYEVAMYAATVALAVYNTNQAFKSIHDYLDQLEKERKEYVLKRSQEMDRYRRQLEIDRQLRQQQ